VADVVVYRELLTLGVLAGVAWWLSLETFVPFIILSTAGAGIAMLPVWRKKG
jgi:hypothetical protein